MAIIWPGLDLIFNSYLARQTKGTTRYAYPFYMYPSPSPFDCGIFNDSMMAGIVALWKRLNPKAKTGGRVQMDTIELRTAIFAIRAQIDFVRGRRHSYRRSSPEVKTRLRIDDESLDKLKVKSKRMILTLERHLKRANRALQRSISQSAFAALIRTWKAHLCWMRGHIAYFRPSPPVVKGRRIQQQRVLDELMKMAEHGIRNEGYQPPEAKELRRMMRLYVRSVRRGGETYSAPDLLRRKQWFTANKYLGLFVLDRLTLKELQRR